jgi:chromosome segregation ATPase
MTWESEQFGAIRRHLEGIENDLRAQRKMLEKIMSDEEDLTSAITDLTTAITANNAEIETLLTKIATPGITSAQVASHVAAIRALIKSNSDEVTKAQAATA